MNHIEILNSIYAYEKTVASANQHTPIALARNTRLILGLRNKLYNGLKSPEFSQNQIDQIKLAETSRFIDFCEKMLNKNLSHAQYDEMLKLLVDAYKQNKSDIIHNQAVSVLSRQKNKLAMINDNDSKYKTKQVYKAYEQLKDCKKTTHADENIK